MSAQLASIGMLASDSSSEPYSRIAALSKAALKSSAVQHLLLEQNLLISMTTPWSDFRASISDGEGNSRPGDGRFA